MVENWLCQQQPIVPRSWGRVMWPDVSETQNMLDHAARDDPSAVDRLLACHREPLRRMIAVRLDRFVQRREDASDVVQSVLLEASRRLADYLRNPVLPFQLWLRQIARDRLNDVHRRHRVAARRSIDRERPIGAKEFLDRSSLDLAAELRDRGATPAAEAIRRELAERFHAALSELGDDDREILLLRHFEHLTNGESARALGLSEPAAGMRYLRALRRLRAVLGTPPSQAG
jgi:RNA polymerase sigma-70 factor, ECF subfamily